MENKTNKTRTWAGAGILTAIAASICCITPVLAVVAGIGGIASSLSWLEPLRPFFIGVTVLVLGFAWYQQLKPKKEIDCDCEQDGKPSFWQSKKFLGLVTLLAVLLLAFPYYAGAFVQNNSNETLYASSKDIQLINLNIKGMTCTGCEATINNAVSHVAEVVEISSDHKTGTAVIKIEKSKADTDSIISAIEKEGYVVIKKNSSENFRFK